MEGIGKCRCIRATRPPTLTDFSTRTTLAPASASSTAVVNPAMPPPITNTGFEVNGIAGDCNSSILEVVANPIRLAQAQGVLLTSRNPLAIRRCGAG